MKSSLVGIMLASISFAQLSHPVALVAAILMQTTLCCLYLMSLNLTSWFSFILFLIFMGGLMVLFIYIASLASNEKFFLEAKTMTVISMLFFVFVIFMMVNKNDQMVTHSYINETKMLMSMYMTNTSVMTGVTMVYLLLTLIIVVKMTSKYEGPLRNMIYSK